MQEFIDGINKQLLSSLWYWGLLILCGIVIFVCLKYGKNIIGWFGEHWAKEALDQLDKDKYTVLNDIMLAVNGKTYQIDHIVLSKYGIFVIETKQYNGYITGNKYDNKWVRHFKGNETMYYPNPIKQNYGHVKAVCDFLNISERQVFNLVCFTSDKVKLNVKHDGEVVRNYDINKTITAYKKEIIDNVDELTERIVTNNIVDKDIRKRHIERINATKGHYDDKICPSCGGKLKLKSGKYGNFLGCENYPKCKYTRKV